MKTNTDVYVEKELNGMGIFVLLFNNVMEV